MFSDIPLDHNIVITSPASYIKDGETINFHKQRAAFSTQEAANFASEFMRSGKDVFYGIGLFADNIEQTPSGKTKVKRTKKNSKFLPALIADIDCGEGKPYASAEDGAAATIDVMTSLGFELDEYTLICSGGGVHLYVKLEDILIASAWEKLAAKFKNALLAQKLDIDISKTTDVALILRPVGTYNFKKSQPRPVSVIHHGSQVVEFERLDKILNAYAVNPELKMSYAVETSTTNIFAQMPADLPESNMSIFDANEYAHPKWQDIKCPQLMALEQDCNVPEPLWYQALGVAAYTEDPQAAAVTWSKQYARFNQQATMIKMAQYIKAASGPALCSTFDNLNSELCKTCKFKGLIKTPIQATIEIGERVVSVDTGKSIRAEFTLPPEYRISPANEIIKIVDGMEVVISDYLVFLESVARHEDTRNPQAILRFAVKLPAGMRYLELDASAIVGNGKAGDGYQTKFFQLGVAMSPKKMKNLGDYIIDCYRFHQDNHKDISMKATMGWIEGEDGFVWGDKIILPQKKQETVLAANSTMSRLAKHYSMRGDLTHWKEAVSILGMHGVEHLAFAVLLGFASPLYRFTNLEGVTVNFYSEEPGGGKSTACNVAQSIFGVPNGLTMEKTSSPASIFARLGTIKNLPAFMDEVSDSDGARISDLLYSVATGKERGRSDVNGDLKDIRTWSLIFMMTSNKSMHDKLDEYTSSSGGQSSRLIEVLSNPNEIIDRYGQFINQTIAENCGVAAPLYLSYLVDSDKEGKLKENLRDGVAKFEEHFNFKFASHERFIKAAVIMAWVAGLIAKKIDLIPNFDIDRIINKTLDIVRNNRQRVLDSTPSIDKIIGDFLVEKNRFIIQNYTFIGLVNPNTQPQCWVPDEPKARMDVSFRVTGSEGGSDLIIPNSAILTIPVKIFRDYCRINRIPLTSAETSLSKMKEYARKPVSFMANLTARETASGAPLSSVTVDCYRFVLTVQQLDTLRTARPQVFVMNEPAKGIDYSVGVH